MEILKGILLYHFSINLFIVIVYLSRDISNAIKISIKNKKSKIKCTLDYDLLKAIIKAILFILFGFFIIIYNHFED